MKKLLSLLAASSLIQAFVTLIIYGFYAVVIGISLIPSVYLLYRAWIASIPFPGFVSVVFFSLACGGAIFLYFITGALVMGITVRLISLSIAPGKYPMVSFTVLRWMIYSGVYHIAGTTILAFIPMSFLGIVFFTIIGAKIGRNVRLNTWFLNDAYLMEIGDNVIIGGKTDISCHTFEGNSLILRPVKIGEDSLIGQRCYIGPGVTIGKRCVIGQYAFVRKNQSIPDGTVISAIAGMPIRQVMRIEKPAERKDETGDGRGLD